MYKRFPAWVILVALFVSAQVSNQEMNYSQPKMRTNSFGSCLQKARLEVWAKDFWHALGMLDEIQQLRRRNASCLRSSWLEAL